MWTLIKQEYAYTKVGLAVMGLIMIAIWVVHQYVNDWDLYGFIANSASALLIGVGIIGAGIDNEKRDLTYARLPVPIRDIGLVRMAYMALAFVPLVGLWVLFMLVHPDGPYLDALFAMASAIGLSMIIYCVFALSHDFGFYGTHKYRAWLWGIVAASAVILLFATVAGDAEWWHAYTDNFDTFGGMIGHLLVGTVVSLYAIRVFTNRQSFLK